MGLFDELKDMKFGEAYSELAQTAVLLSIEKIQQGVSEFGKGREHTEQMTDNAAHRNEVRFG